MNKHIGWVLGLGGITVVTAYALNKLDWFHDDNEDYKPFESERY